MEVFPARYQSQQRCVDRLPTMSQVYDSFGDTLSLVLLLLSLTVLSREFVISIVKYTSELNETLYHRVKV